MPATHQGAFSGRAALCPLRYAFAGPLRWRLSGEQYEMLSDRIGSAAPVRDSQMQPFTFDFAGSAFAIRE